MNTKPVDQAFTQALQNKIFSGAQILLGRGRERIFSQCYGALSFQKEAANVGEQTLFDIASITKVVATTPLCLLALEAELINLEDPIGKWLPTWQGSEKITLKHLLAHSSGLPAWLPLAKEVTSKNLTQEQITKKIVKKIGSVALVHSVGEKRLYSDLGFILLGFILEKVFRAKLDILFEEKIQKPQQFYSTFFKPEQHIGSLTFPLISATAYCDHRKKILCGEVHDGNAHLLGGVAGHAGLFSHMLDLEKYVHWLLDIWEGRSVQISKKQFLNFVGSDVKLSLGWDRVSPVGSSAGQYFSTNSIGHLGFTGTSLWLDLEDQKYVIFLSNRVHFPAKENDTAFKLFRPKVHDIVIEAAEMM